MDAVLTAENHNVTNGLGSAVAEVLVENYPVVMGRIGSKEKFGEVGDVDYLIKAFEMSAGYCEKSKRSIGKEKVSTT